jgi:hypothetical protein
MANVTSIDRSALVMIVGRVHKTVVVGILVSPGNGPGGSVRMTNLQRNNQTCINVYRIRTARLLSPRTWKVRFPNKE